MTKPRKSETPVTPAKFAPIFSPPDELPIRTGKIACLKCGKKFKSSDVVRNRICTVCEKVNRAVRIPRITPSYLEVDGRTIHLAPDD